LLFKVNNFLGFLLNVGEIKGRGRGCVLGGLEFFYDVNNEILVGGNVLREGVFVDEVRSGEEEAWLL
jgi:hypothetical protein